jgi:hypothetical protein
MWIFAFILLFSLKAQSTELPSFDHDDEPRQAIAKSIYWHRLLHYQPRFLQKERGQSDDKFFYLSPQGRLNPLAELDADILAFGNTNPTGRRGTPAQCTFPERYRYLKTTLHLNIADLCLGFFGQPRLYVWPYIFAN